MRKFEMFKKDHPNSELWNEAKLKELGIKIIKTKQNK